MNKFLKLPLFLGGVCLFFCTSLAIVVNICQPRINENEEKKEKEAYLSLYKNDIYDLDSIETVDVSFEGYEQIDKLVKISHINANEECLSYVYSLTTKDPQSGKVSFMLGIDYLSNKVDAYAIVSNNNSGYATEFNNTAAVLNGLIEYGEGGNFYRTSGATKTEKVMQDAVNQAFKHYKNVIGGAK